MCHSIDARLTIFPIAATLSVRNKQSIEMALETIEASRLFNAHTEREMRRLCEWKTHGVQRIEQHASAVLATCYKRTGWKVREKHSLASWQEEVAKVMARRQAEELPVIRVMEAIDTAVEVRVPLIVVEK
jgi:hypothetical protein